MKTSASFSLAPTISPPTMAPVIESKPPMISTGSALSASKVRLNCTPSLAPHSMPAISAMMPAAAQVTAQICCSGMPTDMAA